MKTRLFYVGLLALSTGAVQAQSNVDIYGIVDSAMVSERGGVAGTVNKVTSGTSAYSRMGFRGSEELGRGWSSIFLLEMGFKVDDGTLDNTSNQLFNRQAYIGLKSNEWGTWRLGRQNTLLYYAMIQVADPFSMGYAGTAKNLFPIKNTVRTSNTVSYSSPTYNGLNVEASYSLGEQAGSNTAGRQLGFSAGYVNGPLTVRLALSVLNQDTAANPALGTMPVVQASARNSLLAVNYEFNFAKIYLTYGVDKGPNSSPVLNPAAYGHADQVVPSTDSSDFLLGATVPLGANGKLMASYIRKNDKAAANQDAHQWAIGYVHSLSPRTAVYASYAKISNSHGAAYTVGNGNEFGSGNSAYNAGLRYTF
jgi:predicted porin